MQTTSRMPRGSRYHWDQDTIYCEATCPAEDIFYEGSEDEDYESPAVRRLRYEAAGQRFLAGESPLVFSAALRGPFEQEAGWLNPWRSRRNNSGFTSSSVLQSSKISKHGKENRGHRTQLAGIQDSRECHLPSPESLKQASVEPHPFLEEKDVARVQDWRSTVKPPETTQDALWADAASPSCGRDHAGKKRATSPDWLKKTPSKRRKTDISALAAVQTPTNRRSRIAPISSIRTANNSAASISFNSSFQSTPSRLPPSTAKSSLKRKASYPRYDDDELGVGDDLIERPTCSVSSGSRRFTSPIKRVSPKRSVWKTNGLDAVDSEDELAQDKVANLRAAATLSSPVSIKGGAKSRNKLKHSSAEKHLSPSLRKCRSRSTEPAQTELSQLSQPPSAPADLENDDNANKADPITNNDVGQNTPESNIQQDDSFGSRMQPKSETATGNDIVPPADQRQSSPLSSVSSWFDSESWYGLSSLGQQDILPEAESMSTQSYKSTQTNNALEEPEHSQSCGNDSIVVDTGCTPDESHEQRAFETHGVQAPASDVGSTSDDFSEISEPSTMESISDPFHAVTQDEPDDPSPESATHNPSTLSEVQSTQELSSEDDDSAQSRSESSESSESQQCSHEALEDASENASEPLTTAAQVSSQTATCTESEPTPADATTTTIDVPMMDAETTEIHVDEPPDVEMSQSLIADSDGASAAQDPKGAMPEPMSRGFSFRNMLQRLVPFSSRRKTQQKDSEMREQPSTTGLQDYTHDIHIAQPNQTVAEESIETNIEQPPAKVIKDCEDETAPAAPTSPACVPEASTMMSPQQEPDSVQRISHQSSEPPQVEIAQETAPAEMDNTGTNRVDVKENVQIGLLESYQHSPRLKSQETQGLNATLDSAATTEAVAGPRVISPAMRQTPSEIHAAWPTAAIQAPNPGEKSTPPTIDGNENEASYYHKPTATSPMADLNAHPTTPPRPSTPESQFTIQPFSAFMSPSPEHHARKIQQARWKSSSSRLPRTKGILTSALKTPWSGTKSNRRVSWAPLPGEKEQESPSRVAYDADGALTSVETKERAASPPPMAAIEDLPTANDADFQGHFNAVAKRANETPRRILPSESQETDNSPGPCVVAEDFPAADKMGLTTSGAEVTTTEYNCGDTGPDPGDEVDLTEQVFQDLEQLLRPWDLDAELEQARSEPEFGAPEIGV